MTWRIFTGWIILYLLIALISGVMTKAYIDPNCIEVVSLLMQPEIPAYTNPIGGVTSMFSTASSWVQAFINMITLDFAIFNGEWQILRIFFLAYMCGAIVYLVITGVRQA